MLVFSAFVKATISASRPSLVEPKITATTPWPGSGSKVTAKFPPAMSVKPVLEPIAPGRRDMTELVFAPRCFVLSSDKKVSLAHTA